MRSKAESTILFMIDCNYFFYNTQGGKENKVPITWLKTCHNQQQQMNESASSGF